MGRSRSTTTTTQQTQQFDERIGASDEAVVISLRDGSTITVESLTDDVLFEVLGFANEANQTAASVAIAGIKSGEDLASEALDLVQATTEGALATTEGVAGDALSATQSVAEQAFAFGTDVFDDVLELVVQSQTSAREVQEAASDQVTKLLEAQRSEAAQGLDKTLDLVKVLGIAAAGAVAVRALAK